MVTSRVLRREPSVLMLCRTDGSCANWGKEGNCWKCILLRKEVAIVTDETYP